ncbi:MAG: tetratricopeptide repeat protein [Planctomycetota bacterium]|jgi:tetratricopeptide (TPR) repeat protein
MADASKFLSKADEALKKRNYDYAIQMYESAMQVEPGNAKARKNFRLALMRKYEKVGYPKKGLLGAGGTMIRGKDPVKLLVATEKLVIKDPKSIKYNMRVGQTLFDLGHFDACVVVMEFAVKVGDVKGNKEAPTAFKLLANALLKTNRAKEAQMYVGRAAKMSPNDKDLQTLNKSIAAQMTLDSYGNVDSSRDMMKNSAEQDLLELLNKRNLTAEDEAKLLEHYEGQLRESPLDRKAIRGVGEVLAKRRKYNDAYQRLLDFWKTEPAASEIGDKAADYKRQYFEYQVRRLKKHAEEHPEKTAAVAAKIKELNTEKAAFGMDEYARQVDAAPTDLEKRYKFGMALFDAGNHIEAFKHLQKAVKSPKYFKKAGVAMGKCLLDMGRIDMAEAQFHKVEAELGEGDEELGMDLTYYEADILERKGNIAEALEKFRELFLEQMDFKDVESRIEQLNAKA